MCKPGELNFIDCTNYCTECYLDKETLTCKKHNAKVCKLGNQYIRCTPCWAQTVEEDFWEGINKLLQK